LTELNLSAQGLTGLCDESFGEARLPHLKLLNCSKNYLTALPASVAGLRRLETVFFLGNRFETYPAALAPLPKLTMVSFKTNRLRKIPEGTLAPSITWLILTGNALEALPHDLGQLRGLRKLMLSGNRLAALPDEIGQCRELELVRLSDNALTRLPEAMWKLPRLAWIALSGPQPAALSVRSCFLSCG